MLWKQAIRSVWRNKKSYLACMILMTVGISVYISFHLLFVNLKTAMESMYAEERFAHVFASVGGIPLSSVEKLEAIDGVARADAAIVADARVLGSGPRMATLRLISFRPEDENRLNNFILQEGSLPGSDGILVGEAFATANHLHIGDSIQLALEGQTLTAVITGLVNSPEYIYSIPDSGQLMPDNEVFGFAYLPMERLGAFAGRIGSANRVSVLLEEGASFRQVEPYLEEALAPYGLAYLTQRKDQPSHAMLQQEINSVGAMASSLPMMFILIAIIILYIMLKRMIEQERSQIGTMKAFGLSDLAILGHYLCYGGITGLAGGLSGMLLGILLNRSLTVVFLDFFSLPAMEVPPDPRYLMEGMAIALGSGLLGALMGARSILRLTPSEAMRPPAPPGVKQDIIARLPFLRGVFNSLGCMAIRNITRNKFRSAFVLFGIAVSFAITAFMASYGDMFDIMLLDQFTKVELYDVKVSLKAPAPYTDSVESAYRLEGVERAEGMVELPVELSREHLTKNVSLTGVEESSTLYRIYDNVDHITLPPPKGGLILSDTLAKDLKASRGDLICLKTPYTGEEIFSVPLLGIIHSNLGASAYMEMESLWELLGTAPAVSSLLLSAEASLPIREALLDARQVAAVTDQEETRKIYLDMLESYAVMIYLLQLSGVVIAFAIITNTATISLSERKREYATLRVMGMHPREVGKVVGLEYWILTLIAIPPGILLTRLLKEAMSGLMDNELFSMPVYTAPSSFVTAAVLCMAAVLLSNGSARRKIATFDMVEVLKERE